MLTSPNWRGRTVVVMGSGVSAYDIAPHVVGRFPIIGTNLAFRLGLTETDVLYAADAGFWRWYPDAHEFPGLKVAPDKRCQEYCPDVVLCEIVKADWKHDRLHNVKLGRIGNGGNSGFQALNLAIQFGATRILLAGLDFADGHWHEDHKPPLHNPESDNLARWREKMDAQAALIRSWGIEVYNLSPISKLKAFPYVDCTTLHSSIAPLSA